MRESYSPSPIHIGQLYDQQAVQYKEFADNSFSWRHIEQRALVRYLSGRINDQTRILDIGVGTGRVIQTLVELGASEENITGIDVSQELLSDALNKYPHAQLIRASSTNLPLKDEQYDVVTSNMVFQYLDNKMLTESIGEIYRVLVPNGLLCFVEPHPLHNDAAIKGENNNKWLTQTTPWGELVHTFNRDPWDLMDILELGGFNWVDGYETLPIEGLETPSHDRRYSRAGYLWMRVDEETKKERNNKDYIIPSLYDALGGSS